MLFLYCSVKLYFIFFKQNLIEFFTEDQVLINLAIQVIDIYMYILPLDYTQCLLGGYVRGVGKENIGAMCFIVCYYFIGISLAYIFGNYLDYNVRGLWIGMGSGIACAVLSSTVIIIKSDLNEQVEMIKSRIEFDGSKLSLQKEPLLSESRSEANNSEKLFIN